MTSAELEVRVRQVVEQVQAQQLPEDDLIELKADWPEPPKAARRLAAHANTARGEEIIWLIGVDERTGIAAHSRQEPSAWLSQVEKCFDGPHPRLVHHRVITFPSGMVIFPRFRRHPNWRDTALGVIHGQAKEAA